MRIETVIRKGREFAVIPVEELQKLMEDAEMLADVKAYDAAKARLRNGEGEVIPLGDHLAVDPTPWNHGTASILP